jgi:hypothetical protein
MAVPKPRTIFFTIVVLAALAVIGNMIAGMAERDSLGFEAAKAACQERGLHFDELNLSSSKVEGGLLGSTADVSLKGRKDGKLVSVRVGLRKALHFQGWQVIDVREETAE